MPEVVPVPEVAPVKGVTAEAAAVAESLPPPPHPVSAAARVTVSNGRMSRCRRVAMPSRHAYRVVLTSFMLLLETAGPPV